MTTLREAVANLIKVKGRHNTEIAYQRLIEAYDAELTQPEQKPVAQVQVAEDYYPHVIFLDGVDITALDQKFLYIAPPQQPEPPCKTGSQCVGNKCERCAVQEQQWRDAAYRAMDLVIEQQAQPEQEPVLWAAKESMSMWGKSDEHGHPYHIICKGQKVRSHQIPLYTATPQREWVGLTDEEKSDIWYVVTNRYFVTEDTHVYADAIEAKLREKNS